MVHTPISLPYYFHSYELLGCWRANHPAGQGNFAADAARVFNCVIGTPARDGQWRNIACTTFPTGNLQGQTVKKASICESDVPTSTTASTSTSALPPSSGSPCFESGTSIMMGIMFILLLIRNM